MFIVYKITSNVTGKCYIGQTSGTLNGRWQGHKDDCSRYTSTSHKLYNAMKEYGFDTWLKEVIFVAFDVDSAKAAEIALIEEFDSYVSGYNSTKGGDGIHGFKHTDEIKEYISECNRQKWSTSEHRHKVKSTMIERYGVEHPSQIEANKFRSEETRQKISKALIGSQHTDEAKKKISESHKGENNHFYGKTHSEESRRLQRINHPASKSVVIDGAKYASINEAASILGISWYFARKRADK